MFQKIRQTQSRPAVPIMIWDGECSFCAYWIEYWKGLSGDQFDFKPYQEVHQHFDDIEVKHFKQAVRFVEPDGRVSNGPDAAYRSLYLLGRSKCLHHAYQKRDFFRNLSDRLYQWVATNRGFCFRITKLLFGSNPSSLKPFWAIYLFVFFYLLLN